MITWFEKKVSQKSLKLTMSYELPYSTLDLGGHGLALRVFWP